MGRSADAHNSALDRRIPRVLHASQLQQTVWRASYRSTSGRLPVGLSSTRWCGNVIGAVRMRRSGDDICIFGYRESGEDILIQYLLDFLRAAALARPTGSTHRFYNPLFMVSEQRLIRITKSLCAATSAQPHACPDCCAGASASSHTLYRTPMYTVIIQAILATSSVIHTSIQVSVPCSDNRDIPRAAHRYANPHSKILILKYTIRYLN